MTADSTLRTPPSGPRDGQAHVRFDRAANRYEQHAGVQVAIARRLAAQIADQPLPEQPRILEIGCGTGLLTRQLAARIPLADWTITDLAPAMLTRAQDTLRLGGNARFRVLDGEHPDLPACGFDLICSSMALQWFTDPGRGLLRLAGLLAPGGCLAVAVPVQGSWPEWQQAHDSLGLTPATLLFPCAQTIRLPAGLLSGGVRIEPFQDDCGNALGFLRALKGIGATTPRPGSSPLTVPQLRQVCAAFDRTGARCTYRIAFGLWHRTPGRTRTGHADGTRHDL